MNAIISIIVVLFALAVGAVAGYFYHRYQSDRASKTSRIKPTIF